MKNKWIRNLGIASLGLISLVLLSGAIVTSVAAQNGDADILRDCDVRVTRYTSDYSVGFEVREGHGGRSYLMEIDGASNENQGWASKRTDAGFGFTIPYSGADAQTTHTYRVKVGNWARVGHVACESDGVFRVKS